MEDEQQNHPDPGTWWFHRRLQAYIALFSMLVLVLIVALANVPEHAIPAVQTALWVLAGIVAVYSGGASIVDAMSRLRK